MARRVNRLAEWAELVGDDLPETLPDQEESPFETAEAFESR